MKKNEPITHEVYTSKNGRLSKAEFKHLKFDNVNGVYKVTLVDSSGMDILCGYGTSAIEAINDMHHNLI